MMYGAKSFGRYHFFKSEQQRNEWIASLPEWEQKHVESWTTLLRKKVG